MLSVDTNVVVRFLVNDDAAQFARAEALLADNDVWVGLTVVLETEWVLRSVYRHGRADFIAAMTQLGGLPRLQIEEMRAVRQALEWHAEGMDFADALHAATSDHCETFVTFDAACRAVAARVGLATREP